MLYCFSRSSVKFQGLFGLKFQFEFTNGYEMMLTASSTIEEVPYCFSRSSVKFQGHTGQKIGDFDPNWAFPDCNFSLNSLMAMKCCTRLLGRSKLSNPLFFVFFSFFAESAFGVGVLILVFSFAGVVELLIFMIALSPSDFFHVFWTFTWCGDWFSQSPIPYFWFGWLGCFFIPSRASASGCEFID